MVQTHHLSGSTTSICNMITQLSQHHQLQSHQQQHISHTDFTTVAKPASPHSTGGKGTKGTDCSPQACRVFTPVMASVKIMPVKPSMANLHNSKHQIISFSACFAATVVQPAVTTSGSLPGCSAGSGTRCTRCSSCISDHLWSTYKCQYQQIG